MDLDTLKNDWQIYESQLDSDLKLDLDSIKDWTVRTSKREFQKPLFHEIANIVVVSLTSIAVAVFSFKLMDQPEFSIPGFFAVIFGFVHVYFASFKARKILNIDYARPSIIQFQRELSHLHLKMLEIRKIEYTLFPLILFCILPVVFKFIQNRNLYQELEFFLFEILFIIGFGYLGFLWINKNLYDKKFSTIESYLIKINEFEKEK